MTSYLENIGFEFSNDKYEEFFNGFIGDKVNPFPITNGKYSYCFSTFANHCEALLPIIKENHILNVVSFFIEGARHLLVSYPEKVSKGKYNDLYSIDTSLCPLVVEIPNANFIKKYKREEEYLAQVCGIAYSPTSVFKYDEENIKDESEIEYECIFPSTLEEKNNVYDIEGTIKEVKIDTNKITNRKFYELVVACEDLEFLLATDINNVEKTPEVGDMISGYFVLYAKLYKKYKGYEYGKSIRCIKDLPTQTLDEFFKYLVPTLSKDTAHPTCQKNWKQFDCFLGQCAVVAMLVQEYFGGELRKIKFEDGSTHYFNYIDGKIIDLCSAFYSTMFIELPYEKDPIIVDRSYCESNDDTVKRYEILKSNLLTNIEFRKRM